jgi:PDZ domain-containing protein
MRFSRTPLLVKLLFLITVVVPLAVPLNFVLIQPGEGSALFPKVLQVKQSPLPTYKVNGQLYLLSIYVTNPDAKVLGYQVLQCWALAECVVMPRSVMYQEDTDTKAEIKKGKAEMKKSQSTALSAAQKLFATQYPAIKLNEVSDSSLKVSLKNTGGPSGGLIFALAITDLFTPEDMVQGRKIAASGTISAAGKIGPIGGIAEKIIAAKKAGATLLFASRENCDELPTHVSGITVVAVSRLRDAVTYLQKPVDLQESEAHNSSSRPVIGCTSLGA